MKEPISIKEILAIVIKRGKEIICAMLVFAILAAGVRFVTQLNVARSPANSAESIESRYQEAMEEYEEERSRLEEMRLNAERKLAMQQEYIDNSILMQIDPYNKYESNIVLAITNIGDIAFQQVYQQEETPVDYIISKIQSQYKIYWDHLSVNDELENIPYETVEEKYLREAVALNVSDGGTLTITAYGESEENAEALCNSVYDCIMDIKSTIKDTTYAHNLAVISRSTKVLIDQNLETKQQENLNKVKEYTVQYEECETLLAELQKPARESGYSNMSILKSVIKWGILGAVVGFLLACATVWLLYILRDGIETSRQAEAILGIPFLGSTAAAENVWNRLAYCFIGERQWNSPELAAQFITENVVSRLDEKENIAVISTLPIEKQHSTVQFALNAMDNEKRMLYFVNSAENNPDTLKVVRNCKYVILAERLGKSSRQSVLTVMDMVRQNDGQVLGFVLI